MNLQNVATENSWQTALRNTIKDPKELFQLLDLDEKLLEQSYEAANLFALNVPRSYAARIQKNNLNDPLLRQVLPLGVETVLTPGYVEDPLEEKKVNPVPGLLHKYHGRVLFTLTGVCGINCRYCFRRHFPYADNNPGRAGWKLAFQYISNDPTITEIILSGGDPLIVSDALLAEFIAEIRQIPHIKRLRIHSRLPIVLPERITPELVALCQQSAIKIILVTHCNHPQEIDDSVIEAMQALKKAGVTLLNQTVLLKGINDQADILVALSETLFSADILPYYLHVLDKVQGAAHFDLEPSIAKQLHADVCQKLPGFLVPKLVCEQPGAPSKLSLA